MKVSKKAYYGLRAVLALAQTEKPLSIHTLAEMEHLPETYLEKILQTLRKANLVVAQKGVTGGYTLSRPAGEINVWEILRELDPPMKTFSTPNKGTLPARNATHSVAGGPATVVAAGWPCPLPSHCQTNEVWRILENKIEETLSNISLASLVPKNTLS